MDIVKELQNYNKIAISGHISPDGDSIGSSIALGFYLRKVFPDKDIRVFLEEIPDCFKGIEGWETVDNTFLGLEPDAYVLIDATPDRMGAGGKLFEQSKLTINIDHHISNKDGSGDINYIDPAASSAAEMVYRLMDKSLIDKTIATWLYVGIVHDTGVFKYQATSPETMRIAADLMSKGIDTQFIIDKTYYEKTYSQNRACAYIVLHSKLYMDNKVIIGAISLKEMADNQITKNDLEGVINQLRITSGVEVAVFMYGMNEGTMKVSMRSQSKVDVSEISQKFGGGGHIRAAGFYQKGNIEEVTKLILDALSEKDF